MRDDYALVLASAYYHPDADLRATLHARIAALVEDCQPRHTEEEVGRVLLSTVGTPIEPFALDDAGRAMAIAMVRIAFSLRGKLTRFRVVGCETIGNAGGLVLTDHLRDYYVERYALGRHRHAPSTGGFIAPGAVAAGVRLYAELRRRGGALLTLTDAGPCIAMPWVERLDDVLRRGGDGHGRRRASPCRGSSAWMIR